MKDPFDPEPRTLCPDPQLGTREGWGWCADCGGIQAPGHEARTHWSLESLDGVTPSDELRDRIFNAIYDDGVGCAICERPTANGICTECRRRTSPLLVAQDRAEYAESLLCAMAFDHQRDGSECFNCALHAMASGWPR